MNCRLLRGGVVACGLLISTVAGAAEEEPEKFDWPIESFFLSDVPQLQEPGAVQVQASFHLLSAPDGVQLAAPLEGEVGLGHRLQLASEVEWNREREDGELTLGVSEVSVGVLYGLWESADTGFALSTGLDGEVARPEFSDDRWALYGRLLAFKQLGALGLNAMLRLGFAYTRAREGEPRAELGLSAAWSSGTFVPTVELHAELGDENSFEAVGGLKIKPAEVVELGVGGIIGRHGDDGVYGATTSLLIDLGG